jgi:oxygen-independent coproporphyrinogen-3 oxidase
MSNFLGVYIHIPFCTSICSYCDFCKIYYNKKYINSYLDNLEIEIKNRYQDELVNSIYIGGGTPTSLSYQELERLLNITKVFKTTSNLEFTIESNIDSLDEEKIKLLKKYNINRISLGVQSFNQKCLNILNRTHTKEDTINIINKLKHNGLTNINIDIIYGIIDDIEVVKEDIKTFLTLDIPHISCYSLIIEPNTYLSLNNYKNIDEDIEYKQYELITKLLKENNYNHYEISNYAKDNYQSLHNLNYWNNGNYYGFGLSSVSFLNNYRITNTKNLSKYLQGNYLDNQVLEDKDTLMSNTMILGLRKLEGVDINSFYNKYQEKIEDVFDIEKLLKDKLIIIENNYLKINPNYLYLSNEILLNFLERRS